MDEGGLGRGILEGCSDRGEAVLSFFVSGGAGLLFC